MRINEIEISRAIIERYINRLLDNLSTDVAVVGAGPSGLVTAWKTAAQGLKTVIFERSLKPGGGMVGGGMMFSEIVVQEDVLPILEDLGVRYYEQRPKYYVADALETLGALLVRVTRCGVKIFNLISAEDIVLIENRVCGLVINWTAVGMANLHIDPLTVYSRVVVDATGHSAEIVNYLLRKGKVSLSTRSGGVEGEGPMWAEEGERLTVENTKELYPGLWVTGMAANAVFGSPRMGPIFGGMFLSGLKAGNEIVLRLKTKKEMEKNI